MKQATCSDLRGACNTIIFGETPDQMGENCKQHVMEMIKQNDKAHMDAIESMKKLSLKEQQKWFQQFNDSFDSLQDAPQAQADD